MLASDLGLESVQDTLEHVLGIEGSLRGDEYTIHCPNPGHADRKPSCSVNIVTGLWNCFACGVAGDIVGLATIVLKVDRDEAERMLRPHTTESLVAVVQRRLRRLVSRPSAPPEVRLPGPYEPAPLTFLRRRGFAQETLRRWGVRYVHSEELQGKKGKFRIQHSIAIPIRDASGRLLAWCYRSTEHSPGWQPKYLYTPEVDIGHIWFGMEHHANADHIVVVEGALDAMWLDQCGVPALAALGAQNVKHKARQLLRYQSVTLLGDEDQSGALMVKRIGEAVGLDIPVRVALYAEWMRAADPQELHPVDVEIILTRAKPWLLWRQLSAKKAVPGA